MRMRAEKIGKYIEKIDEYIQIACNSEDDVPTLAGLALFLNIDKQTLLLWERQANIKLRKAIVRAKNKIEHFYISKSALKKINNSTAHYYLNTVFGYENGEQAEQEDFTLKLSVEE